MRIFVLTFALLVESSLKQKLSDDLEKARAAIIEQSGLVEKKLESLQTTLASVPPEDTRQIIALKGEIGKVTAQKDALTQSLGELNTAIEDPILKPSADSEPSRKAGEAVAKEIQTPTPIKPVPPVSPTESLDASQLQQYQQQLLQQQYQQQYLQQQQQQYLQQQYLQQRHQYLQHRQQEYKDDDQSHHKGKDPLYGSHWSEFLSNWSFLIQAAVVIALLGCFSGICFSRVIH